MTTNTHLTPETLHRLVAACWVGPPGPKGLADKLHPILMEHLGLPSDGPVSLVDSLRARLAEAEETANAALEREHASEQRHAATVQALMDRLGKAATERDQALARVGEVERSRPYLTESDWYSLTPACEAYRKEVISRGRLREVINEQLTEGGWEQTWMDGEVPAEEYGELLSRLAALEEMNAHLIKERQPRVIAEFEAKGEASDLRERVASLESERDQARAERDEARAALDAAGPDCGTDPSSCRVIGCRRHSYSGLRLPTPPPAQPEEKGVPKTVPSDQRCDTCEGTGEVNPYGGVGRGVPIPEPPWKCPDCDGNGWRQGTPTPAATSKEQGGEECEGFIPDSSGEGDCGRCGMPHPESEVRAWYDAQPTPTTPAEDRDTKPVDYTSAVEEVRARGGEVRPEYVKLATDQGYDADAYGMESLLDDRQTLLDAYDAATKGPTPAAGSEGEDVALQAALLIDPRYEPDDVRAEALAGRIREAIPRLRALLAPPEMSAPVTWNEATRDHDFTALDRFSDDWSLRIRLTNHGMWMVTLIRREFGECWDLSEKDWLAMTGPPPAEKLERLTVERLAEAWDEEFPWCGFGSSLECAKLLLPHLTGTGVPAQRDPALSDPRTSLEEEIGRLRRGLVQVAHQVHEVLNPEGGGQ